MISMLNKYIKILSREGKICDNNNLLNIYSLASF